MLTGPVMSRQLDTWDAELAHLDAALALVGDDTKPPAPPKAAAPDGPRAPRAMPLPHSGELGVMRPPLTPELIAELANATAEVLQPLPASKLQ